MTFDEWFKDTGSRNNFVAQRLHVSPNYISMLRKGRRMPSSALMQDISKMTGKHVPVTVWFRD